MERRFKTCELCSNSIIANPLTREIKCNSNFISTREMFERFGNSIASKCDEFDDHISKNNGYIENENALKFILAGKCEFNMVSNKTGVRLGYKITKKQAKDNDYIYYLNVQDRTNSIYAGVIYFDNSSRSFKFAQGKNGNLRYDHIAVKSIIYVLNKLYTNNSSLDIRIYHQGKCGRCGKKLDDPVSILTGLGPTCAKISGVPRVKI